MKLTPEQKRATYEETPKQDQYIKLDFDEVNKLWIVKHNIFKIKLDIKRFTKQFDAELMIAMLKAMHQNKKWETKDMQVNNWEVTKL